VSHTPGPWEVDEPHQVWAPSAGEYVAITQVEDRETIPRDQVEANARLIAAAPELLEAIKELLEVADPDSSDGYEMEWQWRETLERAQDRARAAIAKATGEQ
jgi:hypothetical protein